MANVLDVATYILTKKQRMTSMKLQKLAYYSQAWHLVWESKPLFSNRIEAWANGPVAPDLFREHAGKFEVELADFENYAFEALTPNETTTIDGVLSFYGEMTGFELSQLTHQERPWLESRVGIEPGVRSSNEISVNAMADYYSSLV